jgi:hypothetical protein
MKNKLWGGGFYPNCKCWEIMSCDNLDCPARLEPETPCWEIAKRVEDYRNVSNTCQDCIVYILKKEASVLDKKELYLILSRKGLLKNIVTGPKVCVFRS